MMKTQDSLSPAGWVTLILLMSLFVAAMFYSMKVWTAMAGVQMSGFGWFCLALGVVVTIGLGAGLMILVFYSARHDLDR